ncbi:MAG: hypothetical protein LUM44_08230 [Pyrinomonadaceae bacterium]|nr:hypothetical protein [Pyrinomonadaceae bacterium]
MKVKRTLTIEIDRVRITTNFNHNKHLWCESCQAEAEFITKNEAVGLISAIRDQGVQIRKEGLHFFGNEEADTMFCLNSIIAGSTNLQIY